MTEKHELYGLEIFCSEVCEEFERKKKVKVEKIFLPKVYIDYIDSLYNNGMLRSFEGKPKLMGCVLTEHEDKCIKVCGRDQTLTSIEYSSEWQEGDPVTLKGFYKMTPKFISKVFTVLEKEGFKVDNLYISDETLGYVSDTGFFTGWNK